MSTSVILYKPNLRRRSVRAASLGAVAFGSLIAAAGSMLPSTALAQQQCGPVGPLGVIQCAANLPTGAVYSGVVGDIGATLDAGVQALDSIVLDATGDIDLVTMGNVSVSSLTGSSVVATTAGAVNLALDNVSTSANSAAGVVASGGQGVVAGIRGLGQTSGADSPAILALSAGPIDLTSNQLQTSGDNSPGVQAISTGGPVRLDARSIETLGASSTAALLEAGGPITLNAGVLRTQGAQALGADLTVNPAVCVLLAVGTCDSTVSAEQITTSGFGGIGALVRGAGDVGLNVGVLRTEGGEAAGFNLASSPDACVTLGVGACDTTTNIGNLSTAGDRSVAGVVRAAGATNVNVGVLRTGGNEAAGLDLGVDPAACVILGTGACDTAFSVDDLQTLGDLSPGAVVRAGGDVTGAVRLLRTEGNQAAGLDISGDPTVCAVLGRGGCDTAFTVNNLATLGDGSPGALVRGFGDVAANIGVLRTAGDDAAGLDIATAPDLCILLGPGACSVTVVGDQIATDGAGSDGVLVRGAGPVVTTVRSIDTNGADAAGIDIGLDPLVCAVLGTGQCAVAVNTGSVDTDGPNSPGVVVNSDGPVDVATGPTDTDGENSPGIGIDGGNAPVVVIAGPIDTSGPNSPGVSVVTNNGDQTLVVGPIRATGPGSDGVNAVSGCGNIAITVRDDITAADDGVEARTGCGLAVNVLPAADVFGGDTALTLASGLGTTVDNAGSLTSGAGPAILAEGAGITIRNRGLIRGRVQLTDAADLIDNSGVFDAVGTSDFGLGEDVFNNTGVVMANGAAALTGLEAFNNAGIIDLQDGDVADRFSLSGAFVGQPGSRLLIDADFGAAGTPADRLIVGGAVTGVTRVSVTPLGSGMPVLNPTGVVIVDGASITPGAVVLDGAQSAGFVDYAIDVDTANGDALLKALPGQRAAEFGQVPQIAADLWRRSADAWGARQQVLDSEASVTNRRGPTESWVEVYGADELHKANVAVSAFGVTTPRDLSYVQDAAGVQLGLDVLRPSDDGALLLGVTGGWGRTNARLKATETKLKLDGGNVGAYASYAVNHLRFRLLAKVDWYDGRYAANFAGGAADFSGKSYGVMGEAGYRFSQGDLYAEPQVSLDWVRTDLDGLTFASTGVAFKDSTSVRAKVGMRMGVQNRELRPFFSLHLVESLTDDGRAVFSSGGFNAPFEGEAGRYAVASVGADFTKGRWDGFAQAEGRFGQVEGYGLRLGGRFRF